MVFFKREYKEMYNVNICPIHLIIATTLFVAAAVMAQRLPLSLSGGHHLVLVAFPFTNVSFGLFI
jgi:hypothetical protein